ncbi:MAG: hypothetical protein QOG87_613 [Actinomycetota bacterium]
MVVMAICAACGGSSAPTEELVFLDSGAELAAFEPRSGVVPFRIGGTRAATPDGQRVFRAEDGPAGTVLSIVNTENGMSDGWVRYLDAGLEPRVASNDLSVVLMPRRANPNAYAAEGRERTTFVIAREAKERVQRIELEGNYEPEAFSTDGRTLFVIEYRPPTKPEVYSVRQLDLASGRITPVPSPDEELQDDMRGTARTSAMAPDGKRLYTLYNLEMPHPDGTIHRHAFVHVLDLEEKWAHCVDLPPEFVSASESASALAVAPDGGRVYVANRKAGRLAEIDTEAVSLRRTVPLDLAPDETLSAAASERGLFIGTGRRVVALDQDLRPAGTWRLDRMVAGLQPSADNRHLYVRIADRLAIVDLQGGTTLTTSSLPGQLTSVVQLPPVARSGAKCAC